MPESLDRFLEVRARLREIASLVGETPEQRREQRRAVATEFAIKASGLLNELSCLLGPVLHYRDQGQRRKGLDLAIFVADFPEDLQSRTRESRTFRQFTALE